MKRSGLLRAAPPQGQEEPFAVSCSCSGSRGAETAPAAFLAAAARVVVPEMLESTEPQTPLAKPHRRY